MNFAEWLPDQPAFENAGATEAKTSFLPFAVIDL